MCCDIHGDGLSVVIFTVSVSFVISMMMISVMEKSWRRYHCCDIHDDVLSVLIFMMMFLELRYSW